MSNSVEISQNEITKYEDIFKDLRAYLTKENGKLWGHQLYGSLLFVNPDNRTVFANENSSNGVLTKKGGIYIGVLPKEINIANTAFDWNGKRWTMIMLPLPNDYNASLNLLVHELFHGIQPKIGFANLNMKQNNHLDDLDGRVLLKLELEALKKAILPQEGTSQKKHIHSALLFRNYRHQLYPGTKESENTLELNEGLAEYTGSILSKRTDQELKEHYIQAINDFYENETFVRSFAYVTIPVYGYLINTFDKDWNKEISKDTNLTHYILGLFKATIPTDLKENVDKIKWGYGFEEISNFEVKRDSEQKKLIAEYETKFLESPTLIIQLENMNISFDPNNIMPLKDLGTVYPSLRITDNWGVLTVGNGALLSSNWDKVTVSEPTEISEKIIEGEGWKLELKPNWELNIAGAQYTLKKR